LLQLSDSRFLLGILFFQFRNLKSDQRLPGFDHIAFLDVHLGNPTAHLGPQADFLNFDDSWQGKSCRLGSKPFEKPIGEPARQEQNDSSDEENSFHCAFPWRVARATILM